MDQMRKDAITRVQFSLFLTLRMLIHHFQAPVAVSLAVVL